MGSVFISYRRGETAGEARALCSELAQSLGKDSVFMDVDTIGLGRDFRQVLRDRLESCDLMLALVGRDWVDSKKASGERRLDDPADFVRMEIEAALKRNIPVTPVLVQGAQMPSPEQLPDVIRDFAYRNAFELSHSRWESDVREMMKRLGLDRLQEASSPADSPSSAAKAPAATPSQLSTTRQRTSNARLGIAAAALAAVVAGAGLLYSRNAAEEQVQVERVRAQEEAYRRAEALRIEEERKAAAARAERERIAAQADREKAAAAARAEAERRAADAQAEPRGTPSRAASTCLQGYVWREAFPGDVVCVTPATRAQTAADNRQAAARRQPGGGAYGPDTCVQGFVWREARPGDHVCVSPGVRDQARYDNSQAAARVAQR